MPNLVALGQMVCSTKGVSENLEYGAMAMGLEAWSNLQKLPLPSLVIMQNLVALCCTKWTYVGSTAKIWTPAPSLGEWSMLKNMPSPRCVTMPNLDTVDQTV